MEINIVDEILYLGYDNLTFDTYFTSELQNCQEEVVSV